MKNRNNKNTASQPKQPRSCIYVMTVSGHTCYFVKNENQMKHLESLLKIKKKFAIIKILIWSNIHVQVIL